MKSRLRNLIASTVMGVASVSSLAKDFKPMEFDPTNPKTACEYNLSKGGDFTKAIDNFSARMSQLQGRNLEFKLVPWKGKPYSDYASGRYVSLVNKDPNSHIQKIIMNKECTLVISVYNQVKNQVANFNIPNFPGSRINVNGLLDKGEVAINHNIYGRRFDHWSSNQNRDDHDEVKGLDDVFDVVSPTIQAYNDTGIRQGEIFATNQQSFGWGKNSKGKKVPRGSLGIKTHIPIIYIEGEISNKRGINADLEYQNGEYGVGFTQRTIDRLNITQTLTPDDLKIPDDLNGITSDIDYIKSTFGFGERNKVKFNVEGIYVIPSTQKNNRISSFHYNLPRSDPRFGWGTNFSIVENNQGRKVLSYATGP